MYTRRVRPVLWLLLASGASCVSLHEATGDILLKQGDEKRAILEYEEASKKRPIIDWEFERLRDKRLRVVEGKWSPIVTENIKQAQKLEAAAAVRHLLRVRKDARADDATKSLMKRLDLAIGEHLVSAKWPAPTSASMVDAVEARLTHLTELRDASATVEHMAAMAKRIDEAVAVGLPPIPQKGDRDRLRLLLRWRTTFRKLGFPPETDARLDVEFARLTRDGFTPMPLDAAVAKLEDAHSLRREVRELSAGPAALALADAAWADTFSQALAFVQQQADRGEFFQAAETLGRWSSRVEPGGLHERLAAYARAGREQAAQRAGELGTSGRAFVQRSLSFALGGPADERARLRDALGARTSLAFKPETVSPGGCASVGNTLAAAFPANGIPGRLTLRVDSCFMTQPDRTERRTAQYPFIETRVEERNVQVGTRRERVQVGTHKEQCSRPSSLDGMVWQGVCDVPDYENRDIPIYELQKFTIETEVTRQVSYTAVIHVFEATVRGKALLLTDEGPVLSVSFDEKQSTSADTFSYVLPGKRQGDPGTPVSNTLSAGFSGAEPLARAASQARARVEKELLAAYVAHRTAVARDKGAKAVAAGRTDDAIDAYVQSVLISGEASSEARVVLAGALLVDGTRVEAMLSPAGLSVLGEPSKVSWPTSAPYVSSGLQPKADGWASRAKGFERDVSVSTETYQEGIYPPNEFVDFHVGIVPGEIQNGGPIGSRVVAMVGFDGHYSFLEMLGLRYFFAVHDELGLRFTIGVSTAQKRDFESGGNETGLAMSIDGAYSLVAGLRLPWFSVMGGARAGVQHMAIGELQATGFHFEPAVRVALRFFEQKQLILEASGLVGIPGVPFKNRLSISFPLLGKDGIDIKLSVEQTMLPATDLAPDGKTRVQLGPLPSHQAGLQVGGRL